MSRSWCERVSLISFALVDAKLRVWNFYQQIFAVFSLPCAYDVDDKSVNQHFKPIPPAVHTTVSVMRGEAFHLVNQFLTSAHWSSSIACGLEKQFFAPT